MHVEEFLDFENLDSPEIDECEYYRKTSNDYEELLNDEFEEYDSIIYTENENINGINAHSLILRTRSQYFRKIFFNKSAKKENGKFVFNLPNISSRTLKIILRFIYCGKVSLPRTSSDVLKLLAAVEELNIESLIPCIQEYDNKHHDEFLQQNEKLLETNDGHDTVIHAGQTENLKEIHAHSFILRSRSQYFRAKFSKENVKKNGRIILKMPDVSPDLLSIILRHIYCDKIDLTNLQENDVLRLLVTITQLDIQPLIPYIQKYLIENRNKFSQHSIEILETVSQHESFTDLREIYLYGVCKEPKLLFDSDKYANLSSPLLESILKRDDLNLDETVIWDNLMKWCLAQHPNISQDAKEWNKDDVTMMERTIHKFIPLIRLYHISPKDFLSKVHLPFRVLLPDDLINNILTFHMVPNEKSNNILPPRKPKSNYNSTLVDSYHFDIFSSWIERKNDFHYITRSTPYNFRLLYRASIHGNTLAAFHNRCDNRNRTIVIAKIANTEQIVGGYNPLCWDSSTGYNSTNDSFIYYFADRDSFQNVKVGYSNGTNSILCHQSYGPTFGGGNDLRCQNGGTWYCNPNSYPRLNGMPTENFDVNDYEVFQVVDQ